MMSNWKRCFKLMKYSYNYKLTLFTAVLYLLIAIFMFYTSREIPPSVTASGIMLYVSFSILMQLVANLQYANLVMAAPVHRFMDTRFNDAISGVAALLAYVIYSGATVLIIGDGTVDGVSVATVLIVMGFSIATFVVFYGICFKYFVGGFILTFFLYTILSGIGILTDAFGKMVNYNNGCAFLVGLVIVAAGWLISIGARKQVYKKPMSKYAASAGLRKHL